MRARARLGRRRLLGREADDGLIAEDQMVHPVHRAVRFILFFQLIDGRDPIFGDPGIPRKKLRVFFSSMDALVPEHRGEVQPVIGPKERFLSFRIDELGEKSSVEGGVLANEDRPSALNAPAGKERFDLVCSGFSCLSFRDLFPGKTGDLEALGGLLCFHSSGFCAISAWNRSLTSPVETSSSWKAISRIRCL